MHEDALDGGHLVVTLQDTLTEGSDETVAAALAHLAGCKAIFLDCDIDVIDRSQFPAAPGARPGGMIDGEFFDFVRRFAAEPKVRAIDLTEWDPPLDPTDLSALVAGRWLAEVLAGFETRPFAAQLKLGEFDRGQGVAKLFAAALVGALVRTPAKQPGAVPKAAGGDLIVEHFDHQGRRERHPLHRALARPAAGLVRTVAGEALAPFERLQFFGPGLGARRP